MKNGIVCVLMLFCTTIVCAQLSKTQLHKIDSLKNIIATAKHDTSKINALESWDNIIYVSNPDLDKKLNEDIIKLAEANLIKEGLSDNEQKKYKKSLALAQNSLGIVLYNKGEHSKALDYYSQSLKIRTAIADKKGLAATLNNIAIIYQDQAEYAKAIDYYTKSLSINEEIGDKMGEANCLSNIGRVFLEQNEPMKAIGYQTRSLKIRKTIDDKRGMIIAYNNLAAINSKMGVHEKAIDFLKQSLKLSEELGDEKKIATAIGNIGIEYFENGNTDLALIYLNKSLKKFEQIGDNKSVATFLSTMGNVYKQQGNYPEAIKYSRKAIEIAKESNQVAYIRDFSNSLFEIYELTGDYKSALEMHKLLMKMKDSILNENTQKDVLKKELKYTYEKQKAIDAKEHEKQLAIAEEQEKKQKVVIVATSFILLLVALFSVFALQRLRVTRKQKNVIELQKKIVEEKQIEILASISYAKRLQEAMLPTDSYLQSTLNEYFLFYKPKDIVAGDFYWVEKRSDTVFVAVADCTGHGIPGAIISVICSNALNRTILEFGLTDPAQILSKTRDLVLETFSRSNKDVKDGMDISLLCINASTKEIKWSGANIPLCYISEGKLIEIKPDKQPIGKVENPKPFNTHVIPFKKGDVFYLFSDGYADQFGGPNGKKFKTKLFKSMLLTNVNLSMAEQYNKVVETHNQWKGEQEQVDDICLVGVKI
ncbi:MAG: tetratricopeptide repeat protein [Bacteroidia bacterium]